MLPSWKKQDDEVKMTPIDDDLPFWLKLVYKCFNLCYINSVNKK
jgi:hypothetical protein